MIARHLRPLAGPGALGLADDAAVVNLPPERSLVITADAMVAGIHFLVDDEPSLIARKLLRTNLSDIAAMGATPFGYLTTLSVPRGTQDAWFEGFAAGLAEDQRVFRLALLGGDTTTTPGPVSLSLMILGTVEPGSALRRSGARSGDRLFVSGTIGDGALGLLAARGELADPTGYLADRYRLPQPRLALGNLLRGIASAAMDISDGLVQDIGHLCRASGLAAVIHANRLPLSPAARVADRLALCLTGGDDYELAFAIPPERVEAALAAAAAALVPVTQIGHFEPGQANVTVLGEDLTPLRLERSGWDHLSPNDL